MHLLPKFLRRFFRFVVDAVRRKKRRQFAHSIAKSLTFRQLESRRVLSVNAGFDANSGVLNVGLDNSSNASLLIDSNNTSSFFVDANNNGTFDLGETNGAVNALAQVNVNVTDNNSSNFFWGNNFSSAALNKANANNFVVEIKGVNVLQLNGDLQAKLQGNALLAANDVQIGGNVNVIGDLGAGMANATSIKTLDNSTLAVSGVTSLNAADIDIGVATNDTVLLHQLNLSNAKATVDLSLNSSPGATLVEFVGENKATSLNLQSTGSIEIDTNAKVTLSDVGAFKALGTDADLTIDGLISSANKDLIFQANDQITFGGSGSLITSVGNISLTANADGVDSNDEDGIVMNNGSSIAANGANGQVTLSAIGTAVAESPSAASRLVATLIRQFRSTRWAQSRKPH